MRDERSALVMNENTGKHTAKTGIHSWQERLQYTDNTSVGKIFTIVFTVKLSKTAVTHQLIMFLNPANQASAWDHDLRFE